MAVVVALHLVAALDRQPASIPSNPQPRVVPEVERQQEADAAVAAARFLRSVRARAAVRGE